MGRLTFLMQGDWAQSLIREFRSQPPAATKISAAKGEKQSQKIRNKLSLIIYDIIVLKVTYKNTKINRNVGKKSNIRSIF